MKVTSSFKKGSLLLFGILTICGSCKQSIKKGVPVDAVTNMENEQKQLIDAMQTFGSNYAAAWSGGDPAAVAAYFAPDGSLKVNDSEAAVGRDAITNVAKGFMDAFPDLVVTMDSLVKQPDGLEFHWTLTGTYAGPEGAGNNVRISGFEVWQLNAKGLVQSSIGSFDKADYDRQLNGQTGVGR